MCRRTRLVLAALSGPGAVTVLFGVLAFAALFLLGERFTQLHIASGLTVCFAFWQATAVRWLWKQRQEASVKREI